MNREHITVIVDGRRMNGNGNALNREGKPAGYTDISWDWLGAGERNVARKAATSVINMNGEAEAVMGDEPLIIHASTVKFEDLTSGLSTTQDIPSFASTENIPWF